jgi:hypothetical protein
MNSLRYTLLTDGSSDRALIPILDWLLRQYLPDYAIQSVWADLSRLPAPPSTKDLSKRIELALTLYPCDLLFIHRDAEGCELKYRVKEIEDGLESLSDLQVSTVKVIPMRMTEAWLLFNENAIRTATSNPNGNVALALPSLNHVENLPDPKNVLHNVLKEASQLSGRRLKKFNPHSCIYRISELIDDFSPLRTLPAFRSVENELRSVLNTQFLSVTFP